MAVTVDPQGQEISTAATHLMVTCTLSGEGTWPWPGSKQMLKKVGAAAICPLLH